MVYQAKELMEMLNWTKIAFTAFHNFRHSLQYVRPRYELFARENVCLANKCDAGG